MSIELSWEDFNGIKRNKMIRKDISKLDLENFGIVNINLTPLKHCSNLSELWMGRNRLVTLNLSPLRECQSLTKLYLNSNSLEEIELEPLSFCTQLEEIDLSANLLISFSFKPLQNCSNLKCIWIKDNPLDFLNITPLLGLPNLVTFEYPEHTELFCDRPKLEPFEMPLALLQILERGEIRWGKKNKKRKPMKKIMSRTSSLRDIGIDLIGAAAMAAIIMFLTDQPEYITILLAAVIGFILVACCPYGQSQNDENKEE